MGAKRARKGDMSDNPRVASAEATILAIMFINIMNINNLMEQVVWFGGYKWLSKQSLHKFDKAQGYLIDIAKEAHDLAFPMTRREKC